MQIQKLIFLKLNVIKKIVNGFIYFEIDCEEMQPKRESLTIFR